MPSGVFFFISLCNRLVINRIRIRYVQSKKLRRKPSAIFNVFLKLCCLHFGSGPDLEMLLQRTMGLLWVMASIIGDHFHNNGMVIGVLLLRSLLCTLPQDQFDAFPLKRGKVRPKSVPIIETDSALLHLPPENRCPHTGSLSHTGQPIRFLQSSSQYFCSIVSQGLSGHSDGA